MTLRLAKRKSHWCIPSTSGYRTQEDTRSLDDLRTREGRQPVLPDDYGEHRGRSNTERWAEIGRSAIVGVVAVAVIAAIGYYLGEVVLIAAIAAMWALYGFASVLRAAKPRFLFSLIVWGARHFYYRLNVIDADKVPKGGGALLLANHASVLDFLAIAMACPRPVRFIMYEEYYESWFVRLAAKHMDFIHAARKDTARKVAECLKHAREALDNGEVVCMFPEGATTRTGFIGEFLNGYEHLLRGSEHPVMPVYVDWWRRGVYAQPSGFCPPGMEKRIYKTVSVSFGAALPADTKPGIVRDAVHNLSAKAFELRLSMYMPLHHMFIHQCKRLGGKMLFADSTGKEVNYRKGLITAIVLADLVKRRCADEEMVGIMLPSTVACALVNVAVLLAGKKPIDLNFTASEEAVQSAIERCKIKTILTSNVFLEKAGVKRLPQMLALEDATAGLGAGAKISAALKALLLPASMLCRKYGGGAGIQDLATIIFSSGSTGIPKGIMLTHANIMSNIDSMSNVYPVKKDDVICGVLPLFHSFGFTVTLWFPVAAGVSVAYHPNPLDGRVISELACKWRCTLLLGTSTFCRAYIRGCDADDFGSISTVICGAEKLKKEIADAFEERFGVRPLEGYGVTETSPVISLNVNPYRGAGMYQRGTIEGTTGRAVPGMATKTVDVDSEEDLPFGERGILAVKGLSIMQGYLMDEEKTKEVLKDGWYLTGDVAETNSEGFITLVDRVSRFSKIAGEMVPHLVVEEALAKILGTDGSTAVVTSVSDPDKGERLVVVHLEFEKPLEKIWEELNNCGLPKLYIPRKDSFVEVEEIPVLGSGKVALRTVKELAASRLGV